MSKTKGNVIDPIEVTEKYGTDAVRFTLASMGHRGLTLPSTPTARKAIAHFATRSGTAARFVFMNLDRVGGVS